MDLDILFVGKLFPREKEKEIKSKMKSGMQDAGNALQWNIINGLDDNECGTVKILDYLPIDSYPNGYADMTIEEFIFQHTDKYRSDDKIVRCTNLTVVKQFCNLGPFKRELKAWIKKDDGRKKVLMVYTASSIFLKLAKHAKRYNKSITTVCVIADIPEFLSARELHGLSKAFNDYETAQSAALYKYVDRFILLTEQMASKLKITAPFMVMEGIAPDENVETDDRFSNALKNEKYILYSGTLNYQFGIKNLMDAFAQIRDDVKLVICGSGEAEKLIKERQREDGRIKYLGKIDRNQVIALQRHAAVLVNPRQNNEEFTKYSFPSKTMEYLAAGVPVIAYKLDGIPDEYDEYINYVGDDTPEALAREIVKICRMSEEDRAKMGERAREFVLQHKNRTVQAKRILEFLQ